MKRVNFRVIFPLSFFANFSNFRSKCSRFFATPAFLFCKMLKYEMVIMPFCRAEEYNSRLIERVIRNCFQCADEETASIERKIKYAHEQRCFIPSVAVRQQFIKGTLTFYI